jgi:hypothetical protein
LPRLNRSRFQSFHALNVALGSLCQNKDVIVFVLREVLIAKQLS